MCRELPNPAFAVSTLAWPVFRQNTLEDEQYVSISLKLALRVAVVSFGAGAKCTAHSSDRPLVPNIHEHQSTLHPGDHNDLFCPVVPDYAIFQS